MVPPGFPGEILVNLQPDSQKNHLHERYRQWGEEPPQEFVYFIERIMPAIAPKRSKFGENCGIKKLSDMYTISDEAFGLLMLLNEFDIWKAKAGQAEDKTYSKKRFVDGCSGNKQGWSVSGINTYMRLCKHLKKRRSEETSKLMEERIMEGYGRLGQNRIGKRHISENQEVAESDYESDDGNEMKDQVESRWQIRHEERCAY